ncbi:InlB B-repeat-containing protein [Paraprevotella clara]|uniref:InlB B-repeat-containing protein n=1 Tax=Paraprevotella clara TaxID=454154 RepID=UPI00267550E2|nr:InlB B-repeat-containing protein [Paraprevotella clara]
MKKITTLICLFTSMSLTYAQEEVTATYLKNADFDSQPTFTDNSGETEAELSGRAYLIEGWTKESNDDWFRAATSNYGLEFESIPDALNSVNPPANNINGEAEGAVLMMSAAWGNTAQMSQSVSLPAGTYELSYDVLNQNAGRSIETNLFGFIPEEGTPVYGTTTTFSNTWTTETVKFTLNDATQGKISIGIKALGKGSGDNGKLAIDNIKLYFTAAKLSDLEAAIRTAQEATADGSAGESYMKTAIAQAQEIYEKGDKATASEILTAIDALNQAVSLYEDATLSDLRIDGNSINGFNPDVTDYIYDIAAGKQPVVTATANGQEAGASVEISELDETSQCITITVTSGKGFPTQVYTIQFNTDYMAGWDADGSTELSPYDAGWRCADENFGWSADVADQNSKGTYRDDLNVGRVFIHPKNNSVFSFPIKGLEVGKEYTFTCTSSKMSGNQGRPTTFTVNTESDGTGTVIGSVTADAGKWPGSTNYSFSFVVPENGDYFLTWKTEDSDGDRSLAWGFTLTQTGEALKITFDSDGGTAIAPQYLSEGDVIQEPEDPVKYGFIFNGWWYNDDGFDSKWNFELGVEKDMTLVAHWIDPTSVGSHSKDPSFKVEGMSGGVKLTTTQAIHVKVYNISGQRILSTSIAPGETTINLPSGIYIVNRVKVIVQ